MFAPAPAEPAQPGGRFDRQDEMAADYLRMCRLRRMSAVELRLLLAGDPSKAAPWVETAARHGVAEAQVRLGQMRLDGLGSSRDESAALAWFLRAARQGSPEAMNMVGRCHENGWGVSEGLTAAAHWYGRAAEAGHDWGEYNLANMLFDGRGVACDQAQAVAFYRRAADKGHARAMNLLARCCEEGWGTPRDARAAFHWYRQSALGGYFRAQFNYATLLAAHGQVDAALGWFATALRDAPTDSLGSMAQVLSRHDDQRVTELAREAAARLMDRRERLEAASS